MGRVDEMSFSELVQALSDFEHASTPLELEQVLERNAIDRRLMRLIGGPGAAEERRASVRVPGALGVKLHAGETVREGTLVDLAEGGVRVTTSPPALEVDEVEVELVDASKDIGADRLPPRASARVTWRKDGAEGCDLGLEFVSQPEGHRRRMRRLVIEILRHLPPHGTGN